MSTNDRGAYGERPTPFEIDKSGRLFHGTKADLRIGDLLDPGRRSNYGEGRTANHVYLTATLDAATWGAELAAGEGRGRICDRIRLVASQPATLAAHEAIVALGFEGTVLKRVGSAYRPGRHRTWIKQKARLTARAELHSLHQDREGRSHALCELDGRSVHALAAAGTAEWIGQPVELVYSRVDAGGALREARVALVP